MEEFIPERYSIVHIRRQRCASTLWKLGVPPEHIPVYLDLIEQYDHVQTDIAQAFQSVQRLQQIHQAIAEQYPEAIDMVMLDFEKGYQLEEMLATLEEMHALLADMGEDAPIE